jgi:hypothetical protein
MTTPMRHCLRGSNNGAALTEAKDSERTHADGKVVASRPELRKSTDVGPGHGRLGCVEDPAVGHAVLECGVGTTVDEDLARI